MKYSLSLEAQPSWLAIMAMVNSNPCLAFVAQYSSLTPKLQLTRPMRPERLL